MFSHVEPFAGDPILSLNEEFQKDPRPHKINLSIGIYFDDAGRIPVLESVKRAEAKVVAEGGNLGWLTSRECAPELAGEIFGKPEIGVLPRLVHSRFGLHVVEVLAREPGVEPPFEAVKSAVAQALRQQAFATALRQYLQLLAAGATLVGVDLDAATSPLVQ